MARLVTWSRSHQIAAVGVALAVLVVIAFAAVGTALATDQPTFCNAACHEMQPFHEAWSKGPHAEIGCINCHVEAGIPSRMAHKVVALGELWTHVSGDPKFPLTTVTPVPDERCISCHENVKSKSPGFDHAAHAKRGACQSCHATAGHDVPRSALESAGILNATQRQSLVSTAVAAVDQGKANVPGHITISCTRCHDLAKTGCPACHTPRHEQSGPATKTADCQTCHAAGEKFVFAHPADRTDCASCHQAPLTKHDYKNECTTCHTKPGVAWTFAHPKRTATCTTCHTPPAKHRTGVCTTCHKKTGVSWAFSHPTSRSCSSCHNRPSSHRSGSCTSCHRRAGVSWAFSHPSSSSSCSNCHTRPSGHRSGSCASCHRTGVSWAFRHTSSTSCYSCHKPPSGHYGTRCVSCHSPSRKWSNAHFTHARIPGGEHTNRSFACTNCHPRGYSTHTCAKCHGNASGPSGD
jgi:hypothetical protein